MHLVRPSDRRLRRDVVGEPGDPVSAISDARFTIAPPPAARSSGTSALAHSHAPFRLTARTRSHSSSAISSNGRRCNPAMTAALLTSASSPPTASTATCANRAVCSGGADVGDHRYHRRAMLSRQRRGLLERRRVDVAADDRRAEAGEVHGERSTEPVPGPGHEHPFTRETGIAHAAIDACSSPWSSAIWAKQL